MTDREADKIREKLKYLEDLIDRREKRLAVVERKVRRLERFASDVADKTDLTFTPIEH